MKRSHITIAFVGAIALFSIAARFLPHAPNFAPIGALALFAGTYLSRKYALFVPVLVMLVTDYFIGFYNVKLMAAVYASFGMIVVLGWWVRREKHITTIIAGTFVGSLSFFVLTNGAVWAFSSWYPHTVEGLMATYVAAIPFFKNTLASDFFYVTIFFGAYELVLHWQSITVFMKKKAAFLTNTET